MKEEHDEWIHQTLDGVRDAQSGAVEAEQLRKYQETLSLLREGRVTAPAGFADGVMRRLRSDPVRAGRDLRRRWLPAPRQWWVPALAGGAAMALMSFGWTHWRGPAVPAPALVRVHFELHAPGARRVELVGNFNQWQPGTVRLVGPDATGHWTATISLPEGRYEYLFLVDGQRWVTDPAAGVVRPDGFGRVNAVLEVAKEDPIL